LDVPDFLDLEYLRAHGKKADEVEMPDADQPLNTQLIDQLTQMGFSKTRAEHAAAKVKTKSAEVAAEWLIQHMDDESLDIPLSAPKSDGGDVDESIVANMLEMGLERARCVKALKITNNNMERAIEWVFSHMDEPLEEDKPAPKNDDKKDIENEKFEGKYRLMAFITHIGKSTQSGHYVTHINSNGKWIIFNDSSVAESQDPPRELAYIYFYERIN